MTRPRQARRLAAVLAAGMLVVGAPAAAFEIFGFRLWGSAEEDTGLEIIDPLPYTVAFEVTGDDDDLGDALQAASALWSGREEPASGRAGLISRARGDYRRILAALYAEGHYGGEISILLAGREAADLSLDVELPDPVPIRVMVRPGPVFRFGTAEIVNAPPEELRDDDVVTTPGAAAFARGERARAGAVNAASNQAIARWREVGHARAREAERAVIADHATTRLDVTITLDPDRKARYAPTQVEGSRRVDPAFIAFMADLPEGAQFDPDRLALAEQRLAQLGVFRSIRVEEGDAVAEDGTLPITVRVQDRQPRTIGFGGTYSTTEGFGAEAFWVHRNLFGRAERLRFDASISGVARQDNSDELDYSLGVSFVKPGVFRPDTDFISSLVARQANFDTYEERSITGRAGFQRTLGWLTGSLVGQVAKSQIDDDFGRRDFLTFGLVGRGEYDRRDTPLDATRGYYLAVEAEPFYEAEFGNFATRATIEGRGYRSFGEDDRLVVAGRAKYGGYLGPSADESPPNQLFFAGGGGSVRGYAFRSIGIDSTDADGVEGVIGGRSLLEGSGELRWRVTERFGAVGFIDGAIVAEDMRLGGDSDERVGAGVGLRYFTGFGPLRIDVAAPLDQRSQDNAVAVYIGIGQAF
jgi:translocation and assembly module TamA